MSVLGLTPVQTTCIPLDYAYGCGGVTIRFYPDKDPRMARALISNILMMGLCETIYG